MSNHGNNDAQAQGGDHAAERGHKKKHHQHGHGDHPEHEEGWIVSFADNVLLMMGFFVVLLAMNMGPKAVVAPDQGNGAPNDRLLDFAIGVRAAFNAPLDMNSTNPRDAPLIQRARTRAQDGGQTRLPGADGNDRDVGAQRTGDWVRPCATVFFSGDFETAVSDKGKQDLRQVAANELKGQHWIIEVRGHVSALEARKEKDGGYLLGFKRAQACAEELIAAGVSHSLLRVTSCRDNERATPRAGNAQGHQNNQRAEVVQTQEQAPGDPYSASSSGASERPAGSQTE